jgi:hypothetical protein
MDRKDILRLHKETADYIEEVYNFQDTWEKQCSQYNIKKQPSVLPAVDRIIVLGDVHGDWDMLMKTLKVAKLIPSDFYEWNPDDKAKWTGKDTVVVQVGDQIDRCRYNGVSCDLPQATNPDENSDWKILQFFTALHKEAEKTGGAVYSLMGNHELMNVLGDMRYVSYQGIIGFGDKDIENDEERFKDGDEKRKQLFAPGNKISNFLACTRQMSLIIGSNLFVHAGIIPKIAKKYSVENLNELMSLYLWKKITKTKYNDIFQSSTVSPLWTRVYGKMGLNKYSSNTRTENIKKKCDTYLTPLKEIYKVDKLYVGHTPLINHGMGSICDDKVWLTDYGASKAFDKFDTSTKSDSEERSSYRQAQVLEILKDGEQINILK